MYKSVYSFRVQHEKSRKLNKTELENLVDDAFKYISNRTQEKDSHLFTSALEEALSESVIFEESSQDLKNRITQLHEFLGSVFKNAESLELLQRWVNLLH